MSDVLLSVRGLSVHFPVKMGLFAPTQFVRAVDDVSFDLLAGETLGLVGESGCGKSTLGRAILRLIEPTAGSVAWLGRTLESREAAEMRALRQDLQIVFQDPLASLDPRMTVGEIVAEPLGVFQPELTRAQRREEVGAMLERVGLDRAHLNRYPHEFSGGQCQRIGIARAMIVKPKLVVCDEAVSALDVSIQAQILNLLVRLQQDTSVAILFISHNLAVVRHVSHRVAVLYFGRLVEVADADALYRAPRHPYTRALIAAVPIPDPVVERARRRVRLEGEIPSPLAPPSGCAFRTRCPHAVAICAAECPKLEADGGSHLVACHRWREAAGAVA